MGKKIQSLNLMSGGEKALVSIGAALFNHSCQTIPFVILDEVEAALDEANVKTFLGITSIVLIRKVSLLWSPTVREPWRQQIPSME